MGRVLRPLRITTSTQVVGRIWKRAKALAMGSGLPRPSLRQRPLNPLGVPVLNQSLRCLSTATTTPRRVSTRPGSRAAGRPVAEERVLGRDGVADRLCNNLRVPRLSGQRLAQVLSSCLDVRLPVLLASLRWGCPADFPELFGEGLREVGAHHARLNDAHFDPECHALVPQRV
eukprot:862416-Rhodomonas_salina.1